MATTSVDILIDPTTVVDLLSYIDAITGPECARLLKEKYESRDALRLLHALAQEIVQEHVYDVNKKDPPPKRSFDLLQSVSVSTGNSGDDDQDTHGFFALYSDPDIAAAKFPTDDHQSYAAFFEEPEKFRTFLKPEHTSVKDVTYRPFFQLWLAEAQDYSDRRARISIRETLRELQPASLK